MFQISYKVYPLVIFLWTSMLLLIASGCKDNNTHTPPPTETVQSVPSPSPQPSPSPFRSTSNPNTPMLTLLPVEENEIISILPKPTDQFTNTIVFFLLDISTSIEKLCEPEFQDWRTQIPEFLITYAHEYHYKTRGRNEEFKIGWATFPTTTAPIEVTLNNLDYFDTYSNDTDSWHTKLTTALQTSSEGLGYENALNATIEGLGDKSYNEYQKIVILISDTYLSYTYPRSDVEIEKAAITSALATIPDDWRLYVVQLPCTKTANYWSLQNIQDDTGFWSAEIQGYQDVIGKEFHINLLNRNNLSSVGNVVDRLFQSDDSVLQNLLPWDPQAKHHGWGRILGQNISLADDSPANWFTYGDTSRLDITAVAINMPGFTLSAMGNPVAHSFSVSNPILHESNYTNQNSQNSCADYNWELKGIDIPTNSVGIFWWEAKYEIPQIHVNVIPSLSMTNTTSFDVEATLAGGGNFTSCYQGRLKINDYIYGDANEEVQFREINNLSWTNISYDANQMPPPKFSIVVEIVLKTSSAVLAESQKTDVMVYFFPELQNANISGQKDPNDSEKTITISTLNMEFSFITQEYYEPHAFPQPKIYLLTALTRREQKNWQQGEESCVKNNSENTVPSHDDKYGLVVEEGQLYAYPDKDNDVFIVDNRLTDEGKISIAMQDYWLDACGYKRLFLEWDQNDQSINWPNVICDLSKRNELNELNQPCQPSELKIITLTP